MFACDKDHQILFMVDPNMRAANSRWRIAAILKKKIENRYLSNFLTDQREIWQSDAY